MSALPQSDWERLNAYHDGELPPAERAALERRLEAEPDLAASLAALRAQSTSLRRMRPSTAVNSPAGVSSPAVVKPPVVAKSPDLAKSGAAVKRAAAGAIGVPRRRRPVPWLVAGALAASLALAFVVLTSPDVAQSPASVHRAFAAEPIATEMDGLMTVGTRAHGDFPDLEPAGLTLIAARDVAGGEAAHYAGRNGCRATLFIGEGPFAPPAEHGIAYEGWSDGTASVAFLSEGMDEDRFAAIAAYVRQAMRGRRVEARVAVQDAIERSKSCA